MKPSDIQAIRDRMNMTQFEFAEAYGLPLSTIRNWEQGTREPRGAAHMLLLLIKNDPEGIKQKLKEIL